MMAIKIKIMTKCLNPTATKKPVKLSRKETEDMLNKLDVSFLISCSFCFQLLSITCTLILDVIYQVFIHEGVNLVQYI